MVMVERGTAYRCAALRLDPDAVSHLLYPRRRSFQGFDLLLFWGIDLRADPTRGPGWWVPDQEAKSLAQAAAIKAVNPAIHLFPYVGGFMAETWFRAQWEFDQPEHAAWWLKDPATGKAIDCNDTVTNVCYGYSQGAPGKLYDWRIAAVYVQAGF